MQSAITKRQYGHKLYWDTSADRFTEAEAPMWGDVENSTETVRRPPHPRGTPVIKLLLGDISCVLIQFEGYGYTVSFGNDTEMFWPATVVDDGQEFPEYDYHGSWSEILGSVEVPRELAIKAFRHFLTHGDIPETVLLLVRE